MTNERHRFHHYPAETHYSCALPALYDGLRFVFARRDEEPA